MEEENRRIAKESKATAAAKLNDTLEKTLYCQESFAEFSEESESERYMEELKEHKASEHSGSPSESIKITSSWDTSATDEVDVLECSDVDGCSSAEISFPGKVILEKDSNKTCHIPEERVEKEVVEDFNTSGQSSCVSVPIILEHGSQSVDASGKPQPKVVIFKVDSMSDEEFKPTDSYYKTKGMISSELQSDQVIEKYVEELVKKVTDDIIEGIQYSASVTTKTSRKCFDKTIQLSLQTKPQSLQLKDATHRTIPLEYSKDSSDDMHCKSDKGERGNIVKESNKKSEMIDCVYDELKMKQQKKALKDMDILSSTIDEIGRMNEFFKNEVTSMLSEMVVVRRSARYVHENLTILEDLPAPACTIVFHTEDGTTRAIVNVYDFGVSLLSDLSRLFLKFKQLLIDVDDFRLKFIELSESFSGIPFEEHVGETRDSVLDSALEAAVKIYQVFFNNDKFEILHEEFYTEREILLSIVVEFDSYINKLGGCRGDN